MANGTGAMMNFNDYIDALSNEGSKPNETEGRNRKMENDAIADIDIYSTIMENAFDGIYLFTPSGFRYVNSSFCNMLHYTKQEILDPQFDISKLLTKESLKTIQERIEEHKEGTGTKKKYTLSMVRRDGNVLTCDVTSIQIKTGEDFFVLGFINDLTQLKKSEGELKKNKEDLEYLVQERTIELELSNEKLKAEIANNEKILKELTYSESFNHKMLEQVPIGIAILDNEGRFKYENPYVLRSFGVDPNSPSPLIGTKFSENPLVQSDDLKPIIDRISAGEQVNGEVIKLINRKGKELFLKISAVTIENAEGKLGTLLMSLDITDMEFAERELIREKNNSEFYFDLLQHDIGNIHQGMRTWLEYANMKPDDTDVQKNAMNNSQALVERSIELVRKVKLLSNLGDPNPNLEPISVNSVIISSIYDLVRSYKDKDIQVDFTPSTQEIKVLTDIHFSELIRNIFENGINAQNGRKDPAIEVNIRKDEVSKRIRVEISDHGPGIIDEKKIDFFERSNMARKMSHTGLGLTVVKELVKRYNGKIQITDRIDGDHTKGAKIILDFPHYLTQSPAWFS